jgi:hypothetical protein
VNVHVDQSRRHGKAGCVQNFSAVGRLQLARTGDLSHPPILEQNVLEQVDAGCRVDEMAAENR